MLSESQMTDSGASLPDCEPHLCHSLAVWSWATYSGKRRTFLILKQRGICGEDVEEVVMLKL